MVELEENKPPFKYHKEKACINKEGKKEGEYINKSLKSDASSPLPKCGGKPKLGEHRGALLTGGLKIEKSIFHHRARSNLE